MTIPASVSVVQQCRADCHDGNSQERGHATQHREHGQAGDLRTEARGAPSRFWTRVVAGVAADKPESAG